jgi:hypothetical protein
MKAFTLSKKSWHWRLASYYGPAHEYEFMDGGDGDLCSYMAAVLKGLAIVCLVTMGLAMVAFLEGTIGAWLVFVINNGMIKMDDAAVAATVMNIFFAVFGVSIFFSISETGKNFRAKISALNLTPPEDSFLVLAYRSFKDKTCVRLVVQ